MIYDKTLAYSSNDPKVKLSRIAETASESVETIRGRFNRELITRSANDELPAKGSTSARLLASETAIAMVIQSMLCRLGLSAHQADFAMFSFRFPHTGVPAGQDVEDISEELRRRPGEYFEDTSTWLIIRAVPGAANGIEARVIKAGDNVTKAHVTDAFMEIRHFAFIALNLSECIPDIRMKLGMDRYPKL